MEIGEEKSRWRMTAREKKPLGMSELGDSCGWRGCKG